MDGARRTLKLAAGVVVGFGFLVAFAAHPATDAPARLLLDLIFWPLDGAPGLEGGGARLLAAIAGGVMVGWGVTLFMLVDALADRFPALGRIVLASLGAWFLVDGAASIASGGWLNAFLNIGFLALFALPVLSRPRAGDEPA